MRYHNIKSGTAGRYADGTVLSGRTGPLKQPIDVEALLRWAYKEQRIDLVLAAPVPNSSPASFTSDGYAPGCYGAIRNLTMGATIDTSARVASPDTPRDAEIVHAAVCKLGPYATGLLILHARTAAPECYANVRPRLTAEPSDRLDRVRNVYPPKVVYLDPGRHVGMCPLRLDPDPVEVELNRGTYTAWHGYLRQLVTMLGGHALQAFHVTGPERPAKPWPDVPQTVPGREYVVPVQVKRAPIRKRKRNRKGSPTTTKALTAEQNA